MKKQTKITLIVVAIILIIALLVTFIIKNNNNGKTSIKAEDIKNLLETIY